MELNVDDIMFHSTEFANEEQQPTIQYANGWTQNLSYTGFSAQQPNLWFATDSAYQQQPQQPYLSLPTPSPFVVSPRTSSDASVFSQWQERSSMASTSSSWSLVSERPYSQSSLRSSTEPQMPVQPPSHAASLVEGSVKLTSSMSRKKSSQRLATPERDAESHAIGVHLVKNHSLRSMIGSGMKRHIKNGALCFGATYAVRFTFWKKTFSTTMRPVTTARLVNGTTIWRQQNRTAGLVLAGVAAFAHISAPTGESDVTILHTILRKMRPAIQVEWFKILHSQPQLRAEFGWNQRNTGRVEGYPENNATPHLQDLLEHYRENDDAVALARLAFHKIAFPSNPPQAPRKDYKDHHTATLQSLMDDQVSWNQLMSTIPEDDISPTDVCHLDFTISHGAFSGNTNVYY
ncbi:hypothetical protein OPT61_g3479 [Boeremia exigua]|uniref:Uncharacterized protein n=1 Tax=Boeremia exigua TaxID=749465 RepID=A0ACC2IHL3_9PLEO|nr:hypothetical protein OPT61_g3479 [Boeremia exigua]